MDDIIDKVRELLVDHEIVTLKGIITIDDIVTSEGLNKVTIDSSYIEEYEGVDKERSKEIDKDLKEYILYHVPEAKNLKIKILKVNIFGGDMSFVDDSFSRILFGPPISVKDMSKTFFHY